VALGEIQVAALHGLSQPVVAGQRANCGSCLLSTSASARVSHGTKYSAIEERRVGLHGLDVSHRPSCGRCPGVATISVIRPARRPS